MDTFVAAVEVEMRQHGFAPAHGPHDNAQDNWVGLFERDGQKVSLLFTGREILQNTGPMRDDLIKARCEAAHLSALAWKRRG
jgi:hypothetical protein